MAIFKVWLDNREAYISTAGMPDGDKTGTIVLGVLETASILLDAEVSEINIEEAIDHVQLDNGQIVKMSEVVCLMDDEILDEMHRDDYPNAQAFLKDYCEGHFVKYGTKFEVN